MDATKPQAESIQIATATITVDMDPAANLNRMKRVVEKTLDAHPRVRLILFGETILGWFHQSEGRTRAYYDSIAEVVPGTATDSVAALAEARDVYICFGLVEREDDMLYNTQVLIGPDREILAKHRKFWIRSAVFTAADEQLTVAEIDGARVAILICADARSMSLIRAIRRADVDVVLASLVDYSTSTTVSRMIGALFGTWAFTANRFGQEGSILWHGLTTITDPWANLVQSSAGEECVLVQDVPLARPSVVERFVRRPLVSIKALGLMVAMMVEMALDK